MLIEDYLFELTLYEVAEDLDDWVSYYEDELNEILHPEEDAEAAKEKIQLGTRHEIDADAKPRKRFNILMVVTPFDEQNDLVGPFIHLRAEQDTVSGGV
jgi:hypothetical protein